VLISSHHKAAAARGDHRRSHRDVRPIPAPTDTTATSRAVVGMIFGLAMIGFNSAFDTDDWSNTIQRQSDAGSVADQTVVLRGVQK
jgi:hypothetical protein